MIKLCCEYLSVRCIWLYVIIMSNYSWSPEVPGDLRVQRSQGFMGSWGTGGLGFPGVLEIPGVPGVPGSQDRVQRFYHVTRHRLHICPFKCTAKFAYNYVQIIKCFYHHMGQNEARQIITWFSFCYKEIKKVPKQKLKKSIIFRI